MEELIKGPFAEVLRRNRRALNQLYRELQVSSPGLNPEIFKTLLLRAAEPVVSALPADNPGRIDETLLSLMEAFLFLASRDFFSAAGEQALEPFVVLLKDSVHLLGQDPKRLVNSLLNAWLNLRRSNPECVNAWLFRTKQIWKLSQSVDEALNAGPAAAWRSGAAQYREAALNLASELRPELVRLLLDIEGSEPLDNIISRLKADPWLSPQQAAHESKAAPNSIKLVRKIGGFAGFGGLFREPPLVFLSMDHELLVFDGDRSWLIRADFYGSALVRVIEPPMLSPISHESFTVAKNGTVCAREVEKHFPEFKSCLSSASNRTTCAVTLPVSHSVFVLGLVSEN